MFILFSNFVYSFGENIQVDINVKELITEEDDLTFEYTITSDTETKIEYYTRIYCLNQRGISPALEKIEQVTLEKDNQFESAYFVGVANDFEPSSHCRAQVVITDPVYLEFSKGFVLETDPKVYFDILTCSDNTCSKGSRRYFNRDENIFVKLNIDANLGKIFSDETIEISFTSTMTSPERDISDIYFDQDYSAELSDLDPGNYEINVIFSGKDIKYSERKIFLGVYDEDYLDFTSRITERVQEKSPKKNIFLRLISYFKEAFR